MSNMSKKLIIIMDEKEPDIRHICNDGGCPFYNKNKWDDKNICKRLWNTPPEGKCTLASLCNYYDTQNLTIAEICNDTDLIEKLETIQHQNK